VDYLRNIPFSVESIAELCTKPGSYEREVARRVAQAVRCDIDRVIAMLEAQKKGGGSE